MPYIISPAKHARLSVEIKRHVNTNIVPSKILQKIVFNYDITGFYYDFMEPYQVKEIERAMSVVFEKHDKSWV
jgi:hypothetical protein